MKTNVYIDSFNLYYGCLKNTPYKWLNLKALIETLLKPHHKINKIKLFSARVSGTSSDPSKPQRQNTYFRALKAYIPEIEIYFGHFLSHRVTMPLATPQNGKRFCDVIKTEEKGSDVNLAVHFLNDAWLDDYECGIIISNDSDLAESMSLVKKHHNKLIGLITPVMHHASKELIKYSDFQRTIRKNALAVSQLPTIIPKTKIHKPENW